jgi:signal peptidase I
VSQRPPGAREPADAPTTRPTTTTATRPSLEHPAVTRDEDEGGAKSFFRELPVLIVLAFVLAIVLKTFVVQAFYIPSGSMEPTLDPGDRVLVNKAFYSPHRFDIVVFADPQGRPGPDRGVIGGALHWLSEGLGVAQPQDEDFIKRVIGLPGEEVRIRNHIVFVNGAPLNEPYLTRAARESMADYGPVTVPGDALFVMGDNRGNSNDSRAGLGFVPLDRVIGGAFVTIWPPSRTTWVH